MNTFEQLETHMFKYTWSLKNFSKLVMKVGDATRSPIFNTDDLQWQLLLYPYGKTASAEGFISMFLHLQSRKTITVYYELMLSDVTRRKLKNLTARTVFNSKNPCWGYDRFINRDFLLQNFNNLKDETLIITCTIHMDVYNSKEVNIQKRILDDYESLFYNENFSDLTVIIDKNKLKVHKNILSARSEVFKAMFYHDMKENRTNTIKITDVSYNIMKEVLLFIYSGKVNDLEKNAKKLLPPADKYGITGLKVLCEKSILKNVKIEDACETFALADLYQCIKLKVKIIEFMIENMKEVHETVGFEDLKKSKPELFAEIFAKVVEKKF